MAPSSRSLLAAGLLLGLAAPGACSFPEYDFTGADDDSGGSAGTFVSGGTAPGGDSSSGSTGNAGETGGGGGSGGAPPASCPTPTDEECGGPDCAPCANERTCKVDGDCASLSCHSVDKVCRPGLVVRCRCTENCSHGDVQASKLEFQFQNVTSEPIPLEGLVLRYYFQPGAGVDVNAKCTSSELENGCDTFTTSQRVYSPSHSTASHVFEMQPRPESGSVPAGSMSGWTDIELSASPSTNQKQHYSFYVHNDGNQAPVVDCERITLHRVTGSAGGVLVWGVPPEDVNATMSGLGNE